MTSLSSGAVPASSGVAARTGSRVSVSRYAWRIYLGLAGAVVAAYFLCGSGEAQRILYIATTLSGVVAIVVGTRIHPAARRLPWLLLAAGLALWLAGDIIWEGYPWLFGREAPYPSSADFFYLSGYMPFAFGFLALMRGSGRPRASDLLDGAIVLAAGSMLVWLVILRPITSSSGWTFPAKFVACFDPAADLALLVIFTQLAFRNSAKTFSVRCLVAGLAILIPSDWIYSYLSAKGTYHAGMWLDAGWLACYALWGVAALHPSMSWRLPTLRPYSSLSWPRISLLAGAMLVPPTALVVGEGVTTESASVAVAVASFVITLLVAARVFRLHRSRDETESALRENELRYRDLFEEAQAARLTLARQNKQLHELDKLKDEVIALVSHELRTPLTSVIGYIELLLDSEPTSEQRQLLDVAERNSHRLLRLVNDLLFVAQVQAGKLTLDLADIDVAELIEEEVRAAQVAAASSDVTLTYRRDGVELLTRVDHQRICQVVNNLVSNALKFTPPGGRVDVTAHRVGDAVVVAVADTGIGISADDREQLFTRFFRTDSAVRSAVQGTGLGLSIVKAIVEAHHGQIGVDSVEGSGSTFRFTLPLVVTKAVAQREATRTLRT